MREPEQIPHLDRLWYDNPEIAPDILAREGLFCWFVLFRSLFDYLFEQIVKCCVHSRLIRIVHLYVFDFRYYFLAWHY